MRRQGERPESIRWRPCGRSRTWSFVAQRRMKNVPRPRTSVTAGARATQPKTAATYVAPLMCLAQAVSAAEILIAEGKSQPGSLTVAPRGVLMVGSAGSPFVYNVRRGATFGMLADAAGNRIWTCQLTPVPDTIPVKGHAPPRGFHLSTGGVKASMESARRKRHLQ